MESGFLPGRFPHPLMTGLLLFSLIHLTHIKCSADLWPNAKPTNYVSLNETYVFEVIPGMRSGYPPEIAEKRRQGLDTGPEGAMSYLYAQGELWKKDTGKEPKLLWKRRLYNREAPLGALISDSGRFVVTIDEHGGNRWSSNAVVIYGKEGELIKRYYVSGLLTPEEMRGVFHSATSTFWGYGHHFDATEEHLVLRIVSNRQLPNSPKARFMEKRIVLETGELIPGGKPATEPDEGQPP